MIVRVGVIGCGAIGSAVARAIDKKFMRTTRLSFLSDTDVRKAERLAKRLKRTRIRVVNNDKLISKSDLIVEAASADAARDAIPKALKAHKRILILSVGGLLKVKNLRHLMTRSRGYLYVPSGAISGIDAVRAAKIHKINKVQITTRKPLRSLKSSPYWSQNGHRFNGNGKPMLIFEGTALEAIDHFPENINVAATLSLAGIGPRRTKVRIFASPKYRYNTHEIEIEGPFGRMVSQTSNVPSSGNAKTSRLAIGSTIAALEKMFDRIKIGT